MGIYRTYIKTFDLLGAYDSEFTEISEDVLSVGDISIGIDNSEFEVGILKNSNLKIKLRNDHGRYSGVGNLQSIFLSKRKDSIIRITYNRRSEPLTCGFFKPGQEKLGQETTVFEGVLNEVTSESDIATQISTFSVLGYESKLGELEVPYGSISSVVYRDLFFLFLNQAPFNELVTVDLANLTPNTLSADITTTFENQTVGEVLGKMLKDTESVLYIRDNTVYIDVRDPSVDVERTFYGQASIAGIENILNIPKYRDGVNRVFNFWTWEDTTLSSGDATSVGTYGVQKKELSSPYIDTASTAKIQGILDNYKTTFKDPKIELDLLATLDYTTLGLFILDRVTVDYPTVYISADDNPIPRYGLDAYGSVRYPVGRFDLTLDPAQTEFKILAIKYSPQKNIVTYKLREI